MKDSAKVAARRMPAHKADTASLALRKWNISLMILNGLEAAAILLFSIPRNYPLNISFLSVDTLQSKVQGTTVTGPAIHPIGGINLAYLVAALFIVAAAAHLLNATIGRSSYEAGLKRGVNVIRSTQFTLELLLVVVALAVMAGVYDAGSLGMVVILALIASLLIYLSTRKGADKRQLITSGGVYKTAIWLAACAPFVLIAGYIVVGHILGGDIPSYTVAGVYGLTLLLLGLIALNRRFIAQKRGKWSDYLYGERWYMVLNILALTLLGWAIFASILHP